jgi:hypothetical protein
MQAAGIMNALLLIFFIRDVTFFLHASLASIDASCVQLILNCYLLNDYFLLILVI